MCSWLVKKMILVVYVVLCKMVSQWIKQVLPLAFSNFHAWILYKTNSISIKTCFTVLRWFCKVYPIKRLFKMMLDYVSLPYIIFLFQVGKFQKNYLLSFSHHFFLKTLVKSLTTNISSKNDPSLRVEVIDVIYTWCPFW